MTRYLSLLLTITLIAIAAGFAAAPVHADPDYDEAAMGTVYNQFHETFDAFFEGTTTVCIVKQEVTAAAATNQQTAYPWIATAGTFEIASSDASDTGEVVVTYIDSFWDRKTATKTLTGQTLVTSTETAMRILSIECVNSGAQDTTNQGTIYVFTGTATSGVPDDLSKVLALIPIGVGKSKGAVFSTPRNVTKGIVKGIKYALGEGVDFYVYLNVVDRSVTYPVKKVYGPFYLFQTTGYIPLDVPLDDKMDVYLTGATGTAAQKAWLGFDVFYRKQ
jgi:hypothetical protein